MTIPNDDATEDPYTFTVIGTALPGGITAPEINVKQDTTDFPSGTEYNFGTVEVGTSSVPVPFTIENLGNDNLTVNLIELQAGTFQECIPWEVFQFFPPSCRREVR